MALTQRIKIKSQVLLIEILRRCSLPDCNGRNLIGLTKEEALTYEGFDCQLCDCWNSDHLNMADIPDWWDEITSVSETH